MRFFKRVILLILLCPLRSLALAPPLEREVNLTVNNEPITQVLQKIQDQTALIFSYQASVISKMGPVTARFTQKTVREVLAALFPKTIVYKVRSQYIILREKAPELAKSKTELSGYVYDKNSDKKLANVTLYDKNTLQSVTTNEYGYYRIEVPNEQSCLRVNKENYRDTCVPVQSEAPSVLTNIALDLERDTLGMPDSVGWKNRVREFGISTKALFGRFKGYINTLNVRDTFVRNLQVSFLPFAGSNALMSGNVVNRYSFNVIGGYSRGTRGVEAGSVFNVDREDMKGLQMAGFLNLVGDSVEGIQLSGFLNLTGRSMKGAQAAGFCNVNIGSTEGIQSAGLFNSNFGVSNGVQLAGMFNVNAKQTKALQAAGLFNVNRLAFTGISLSGMMNVHLDSLTGVSGAALVNVSRYSNRAIELAGAVNLCVEAHHNKQVASLVNTSLKGSSRLQIAALFNRASYLSGVQVAMFNYCDSASGVPIGLFSVVKKGLHQIEVSSDEMFGVNVSLRSGVPLFYNSLSVGWGLRHQQNIWHMGYGLGSMVKLATRLNAELGATVHHVSAGALFFGSSELYKFYAGVEYALGKKMKVSAGPSFNMYISDMLLPAYANIYHQVAPDFAKNRNLANDFNLKTWLGFKVALRFL